MWWRTASWSSPGRCGLICIDENNHKTDSYEEDDTQYRISYQNIRSFNGPKYSEENIESATAVTENGYLVEAAFRWTDITPAPGDKIGIDLQINDAEGGKRIGTVSWYDESGRGWESPGVFGTAALGGLVSTPESDVREELDSLIGECVIRSCILLIQHYHHLSHT